MRSDNDNQSIVATLDTNVLLGDQRSFVAAAAHLRYFTGHWSSWIVAEVVRKRTEWIARRAAREEVDIAETTRRLEQSRTRVNQLIDDLSKVLLSVDYHTASPDEDLSWLSDEDDVPVMKTALAAKTKIMVTDNSSDFPLGEERNGIKFMSTSDFLDLLYRTYPEAKAEIEAFLGK